VQIAQATPDAPQTSKEYLERGIECSDRAFAPLPLQLTTSQIQKETPLVLAYMVSIASIFLPIQ